MTCKGQPIAVGAIVIGNVPVAAVTQGGRSFAGIKRVLTRATDKTCAELANRRKKITISLAVNEPPHDPGCHRLVNLSPQGLAPIGKGV